MMSSALEQLLQLPEKPHLLDSMTSLEKSIALLAQRFSNQFHKLVRRASLYNLPVSSTDAGCLNSLLACRDAISHLQRTGFSQLQQMVNPFIPLPRFSERFPQEWLETNNMLITSVELDLESIYTFILTSREAVLPPSESGSLVRKCTKLLWLIEDTLAGMQRKIIIQAELVRQMSGKSNVPTRLHRHVSLSGLNQLEAELVRVSASPHMMAEAAPLLQTVQRIRGLLHTNEEQTPAPPRVSSPPGKIWFNRNLPPKK